MADVLNSTIIKKYKKNYIFMAEALVQYAMKQNHNLVFEKNEKTLYSYNGKYYDLMESFDFDKFISDFLIEFEISDMWKSGFISDVKRAININSKVPQIVMDQYDNLINLENGVLNLDSMTLHPHAYSFYFSTIVEIEYNPDRIDCFEFLEFLNGLFSFSQDTADRTTIDLIQEIGGYTLYPRNLAKKMFLFLGEGSNGKSMLLDLFRMFFPDTKHVTYLNLDQLSQNGFERSRLVGSRINISTESKGARIDTEEIKKIISGEGITINGKFKEPFEYLPKTKIFIASNTRPYFSDTTYGIYRRIVVIEFPHKFVDKYEYMKTREPESRGIYPAKDETELKEKFKKELPAILNFFLAGLTRLRDKKFVIEETLSSQDTKDQFMEVSDTVGAWLNENYEETHDPFLATTIEEILRDYREWYYNNVSTKHLNYSVQSLGSKIKSLFRIESQRKVIGTKRLSTYQIKKKDFDIISSVDKEVEIGKNLNLFGDNNDT